jgi:folate-binding protein YgfZ
MNVLPLHEFHSGLNAVFDVSHDCEVVTHYQNPALEYSAVRELAGVLDLSFRGRLCLVGADRQRFLNGQVTNDVNQLKVGQGCYAALVSAKGKMVSDLNIYILENEILIDFEAGYSQAVSERLEKYIIADDVQIVDVAGDYGLLSIQGPMAEEAVRAMGWAIEMPSEPMNSRAMTDAALGEICLVNHARVGSNGFDLFAPLSALRSLAEQLISAVETVGGRVCGWQALEIARMEAGIPRFGVDMDETNLPPEAGLEKRAVSYTKGCYIGQEIIARIRTYGQVAKMLRGLRLADDLETLPRKGDKLYKDDKEVGFVTSAIRSPKLGANIALSYVRREANQPGTNLTLKTAGGNSSATIVELPFLPPR